MTQLVRLLALFLALACGLSAQTTTVTPKSELRLPGVTPTGWKQNVTNYQDANQNFTDIDQRGPWFVGPCPSAAEGDFVYIDSAGDLVRSNASASATARAIGIVYRVDNGPPRRCFAKNAGSQTGMVDDASAALVKGADYFLSATTPGKITGVAPGISVFVGEAIETDELALALGGGGGGSGGGGASPLSEQSFSANQNAIQSIPASTATTVIFQNERFDPDLLYDTSTGVFTAAASGKYTFSVCVKLDNVAVPSQATVQLIKNKGAGSEEVFGFTMVNATGESDPALPVDGIVDLASGDNVRVEVTHTDSVARDTSGSDQTRFAGIRIPADPGVLSDTTRFSIDTFSPAAAQTSFTLSEFYGGTGAYVSAWVNGVQYDLTTSFTISGVTFTWLDAPFAFDGTERLTVIFQTTATRPEVGYASGYWTFRGSVNFGNGTVSTFNDQATRTNLPASQSNYNGDTFSSLLAVTFYVIDEAEAINTSNDLSFIAIGNSGTSAVDNTCGPPATGDTGTKWTDVSALSGLVAEGGALASPTVDVDFGFGLCGSSSGFQYYLGRIGFTAIGIKN